MRIRLAGRTAVVELEATKARRKTYIYDVAAGSYEISVHSVGDNVLFICAEPSCRAAYYCTIL